MKNKPVDEKDQFITFRLSADLRAELQRLAKSQERTLGGLLRVISAAYVEKKSHE